MLDDNDKRWITETIGVKLDEMGERMEAMETRLLTEFHRWAQTYEVRVRGTTRAVVDFEERLGLVEERISRLERGRTQPPQ
jgi:hypothetical protein